MRIPPLIAILRSLVHRPGYSAAAILLLALGAASTASVYAVVRGVLLRPLPFHEPSRLVAVGPRAFISYEDIQAIRGRVRAFSDVAGLSPGWLMGLVADGGEPLKLTGAKVTDNLFTLLAAPPALGRTIVPGDGAAGRNRVAVLSGDLWARRFGSDTRTLGRSIELDGDRYTVIGVMPRGFEIFEPGTDVWTPLERDPSAPSFKASFTESLARLAPGVDVDHAASELRVAIPALRRDLAHDENWGRTLTVASLQDTLVGDVRPTLLLLLGAVTTMLLLVAVNLGALMMSRGVERARELAVRAALGASGRRLIGQMLAEHGVLALCGGLLGLLLARALLPVLIARVPPDMPRVGEIALDIPVSLTVLAAAVGLSVLLAVAPAALAARFDLQPLLREARGTETPGRRRVLGALVTAQIGIAVVLGIGAGLMLRSLWNLHRIDPGFDSAHVLAFRLQTTSKHESLSTGMPYFEQVLDRIRPLPGVVAVGAIGHLPMSGYSWTIGVRRADRPLAPGESSPHAGWRFIGWDYYRAMGIPVRSGREFAAADTATAPAVVILNETLARQLFGGAREAIDRELVLTAGGRQEERRARVVGVVGDVRHAGLATPPGPELYRPLAQTFMFPMAFVVRTSGAPASLAAAVRQAVWSVDRTVPIAEMQPLGALLADSIARPRLMALLLSVFAAFGLLIEIAGVYAVIAYRVRQRRREFGVRLALGAQPAGLARMILAQGAWFGAAGLAAGIPAAFALASLARSLVFGVAARDPLTFVLLPLVVYGTAIAACAWPAILGAQVDPGIVLREE